MIDIFCQADMTNIATPYIFANTNMTNGENSMAAETGAGAMVALFNALGDPTRLRLLNLMRGGEICVCFFVEILGEPQSKISRHLAYLRRNGLVEARRQAKWMHYRIARPADPDVAAVLDAVLAWMADDAALAADRTNLVTVCCAPSLPVDLEGAPLPEELRGRRNS